MVWVELAPIQPLDVPGLYKEVGDSACYAGEACPHCSAVIAVVSLTEDRSVSRLKATNKMRVLRGTEGMLRALYIVLNADTEAS